MRLMLLYLKRSFQKNGKNFIYILIAITLTIMLMTIVTVFVDSEQKGSEISTIKSMGTHHVFIPRMNNEQVDFIKSHNSVNTVQEVRYVLTDIKLKMNQLKVASVKDTINHWMLEFTSGSMPEKGEVLIPDTLKQANGVSYIPGDNITIGFVAGDKIIQNTYTVAGTFPDELLCRSYILLHDISFNELQHQLQGIELLEDLYIKVKNDYYNLVWDYSNKYNKKDALVNMSGFSIGNINPQFIFIYVMLISLAMLVGGVCIFTVISLYLKDSSKEYIIFRLLGANNRQVSSIILFHLLFILIISLPVGYCTGVILFKLIARQFENLDTVLEFNVSVFTKVSIPLSSIAVLLISSFKPIYQTLTLPPVQSIVKANSNLSRFISYETKPEKHCKKPFLWYAGVQAFRLKRRTGFLCLTTTVCMSLFVVTNVALGFQSAIAEKALKNAHFTLNIDADEIKIIEARENGKAIGFSKEDIERLSEKTGIRYIKIKQMINQMVQLEPEKKDLANDSKFVNGKEFYIAEGSVQLLDSFEKMHLEKYVVAGKLDMENSDYNSIVLQDDNWSKSKSTSYQIGDKLVLQGSSKNSKLTEFTIRAIVKGVPRYENNKLNMYIASSAFERIYGINSISLDIYCDIEKISEVRNTLNKDSREGGYTVKDNSETVETMDKFAKALRFFGFILSSNILLICTVLLLCYYTYYYKTRQREFRCLGAIGCSEGMITRMIIDESIIYSLISAAASILVSYPITYYIYTKTSVYPNDFDWKIPWAQMGISVFVIIMVNIISVYRSIKKIRGLSLVINEGE